MTSIETPQLSTGTQVPESREELAALADRLQHKLGHTTLGDCEITLIVMPPLYVGTDRAARSSVIEIQRINDEHAGNHLITHEIIIEPLNQPSLQEAAGKSEKPKREFEAVILGRDVENDNFFDGRFGVRRDRPLNAREIRAVGKRLVEAEKLHDGLDLDEAA
jgi:hypothetical protein